MSILLISNQKSSKFFSDEELKRCREPWTIIAFQDTPFNSSNMENFTALATSYEPGRKYIEPLQNFWDLDQIDAANPAIMIDGGWKFRLICSINSLTPPLAGCLSEENRP